MFEVGDLVRYINGESVYKVESVKGGSIKICHLKSGKVYTEAASTKRIVKLKFKIGDKVRVLQGKYKDNISIITGAHITNALYYDVKDSPIGFTENSLELVTEEPSKFKKGDLVYVDSTKTFLSGHHYKVFQVLEVENKDVICSNSTLKRISFREHFLSKFKFQPNDLVQITSHNIDYKKIFIVNDIRFSNNHDIEYSSANSNIWYKESELDSIREYADAKIAAPIGDITTINDNRAIKICDYKINDLEKQVSEIIDTYINNNLNNQKNDENRLQEERTPESRRDQQERVGIYGRRHQVAIRVRYQCHEARPSKGRGKSIRVKDQLSTSYRRTYGSKD